MAMGKLSKFKGKVQKVQIVKKTRKKRGKKTLMPSSFRTTLKYVENTASIDPGVGGIPSVMVMSGNGLYDPNITLVGHQPRGFDNLMPLYDHYACTSSICKIQAYNQEGNKEVILGIAVLDTATVRTDVNDYLESPYVTYKVTAASNNQDQPSRLSIRGNYKTNLGMKDPTDSSLKGTVLANPTEQWYYHIFVAPLDGSTDVSETQLVVEMRYNTLFIEPRNPNQS